MDYYWVSAYKKRNDLFYQPIVCKKHHWSADPFLFAYGEDIYAFFEYTNVKKNKSAIGYCNLTKTPNHINIAYEFDGHTSYPCIFEHNGTIFMIPETCYCDEICLLECIEFPSKWKKRAVLLNGIHAVDTTVFISNNTVNCFVYSFDKSTFSNRKLFIGTINFETNTIDNLKCVVHYRDNNGRPGGSCFVNNNQLFRVVQPSYKFYGEKIVFYCCNYSSKEYEEHIAYEMSPSDITVFGFKKIDGVHTFNSIKNYEIIDVRINFFDPFKVFKRIFRKFGWFGFYDGDNKKTKVFMTQD